MSIRPWPDRCRTPTGFPLGQIEANFEYKAFEVNSKAYMKNNIGVRSMAHEDRFEVKQKDKHEKSKQVAGILFKGSFIYKSRNFEFKFAFPRV